MINLRATYQEECYNKGLSLDRYLIAAKCRFGKTYVGSKLAFDGWNSNITLILSGMNVRTEWKKALIQAGYDENILLQPIKN